MKNPRKKQKYVELWMNPWNGNLWILYPDKRAAEGKSLFWHNWIVEEMPNGERSP